MVRAFGPEVVGADGDLDGRRWRRRSCDPSQKAPWWIVHPEVARRFGERVDTYRGTDRVVVYVTPLLVSSGWRPPSTSWSW